VRVEIKEKLIGVLSLQLSAHAQIAKRQAHPTKYVVRADFIKAEK
jgi:hypothetical protein